METVQMLKKKPSLQELKDDILLQLEAGIEDIKAGRISKFVPSTKKR